MQVVRFGPDLTLLALAGEVVVDYALRSKREFPDENLVVAGYCHDVMCYIPSRRVLREGGYEAVESMIYYGQPGPFAESVEEDIFHAIVRADGKGRGEDPLLRLRTRTRRSDRPVCGPRLAWISDPSSSAGTRASSARRG